MKHRCVVNLDDEIYNEVLYISNCMGLSIPEFLTQILMTDEFKKTVSSIFENLTKEAIKRTLGTMTKKQR